MSNDCKFILPRGGDLVKIRHKDVMRKREKFWVRVIRIIDKTVEGVIDNDLVDKSCYDYGSKIKFNADDIITIYQHKE